MTNKFPNPLIDMPLTRIPSMVHLRFNCILFFLLGHLCMAQQEILTEIIHTDAQKEVIEQKIDAFFASHTKDMSPRELADCYHDVGNKWYHEQWWDTGEESDIEKAIYYTQKALEIKSGLKDLEKGSLDNTRFNLGVFYSLKGEIYKARNTFLHISNKGSDVEWIQKARLELGYNYLTTGDFYKALNQFSEVTLLHAGVPTSPSTSPYIIDIDAQILVAETYAEMDLKEFSNEIRLNLKKADSLIGRYKEADKQYRRRIDHLEGNRLIENGSYEQAIAKHKQVLKDSMDLGPRDIANIHSSIGYSHLKLKNYDQALIHLKKANSLVEDFSLPYENLGDFYLDQNNYEKALYHYQKAIVLSTDGRKGIRFDELPSVEDLELASEKIVLLGHVIAKANGWLKFYEYDKNKDHLDHALKTFALADQLVDIIRSESTEYQSKLFWREKGASLYAKAVQACYLLDKPKEAYYYMERNKALLLLEDVSVEQAKELAQLPQKTIEREFRLKQNIYLSENELRNLEPTSESSLDSVRQRVYESKRIYNAFSDSLAAAFPDYANIKKQVRLLSHTDFISDYISDDEAVLQYILNEEQGYGLLTSSEQSTFFKLDDVKKLNDQLIVLYGQLTDLTTSRDELTRFNTLSHQIFNQLVPETVHETIKGKKLTLITDYILQQIPFEAFVTDLENLTYLIENTEIRYAYSMSYLNAKKQVSSKAKNDFLAIAPITFNTLELPELVFSKSEVEEAERIFPGKRLMNQEATKARFLEQVNDYNIIHLSTHADIGEENDPWIAFSDEKMFLNEVYATKNQADIVVLSACNTSIGELKKGEGAMSLARGFFHSGAKSVVSSLWSTNDKSSKELMVAFYQGLDEGLTKSAALRKAKIDYINKYRGSSISPAYWSALIIIGDNIPIRPAHNQWSYILYIVLGTLLALVLYLLVKRREHLS
ncbi:CHAT domain-containing protein [Zobellia sp. OII3]|uniref:CHAT domain-containing protein n=1 Tax=Zobellia sp. OII3 TaxID=2034520 RepID=UPI000F506752|nr:CHAT domain-containing protein [Zobellia sp. OII3]